MNVITAVRVATQMAEPPEWVFPRMRSLCGAAIFLLEESKASLGAVEEVVAPCFFQVPKPVELLLRLVDLRCG